MQTLRAHLDDKRKVYSKAYTKNIFNEFTPREHIPKPTGTFNGQDGSVSLPRNNIEIGKVGAVLFDFDFELNIQVTSFKMKVPGQPTINCNGTRLSSQAKDALRRARRGDGIQFFDIKAQIVGNSSYRLPTVSPVFVEVAN